jgi:hypothetical protein
MDLERVHDGLGFTEGLGLNLNKHQIVGENLINATANNNNWTRHHQVVLFLYNRELACFTADIHIRLLRSPQYLHTELKQAP